jgi:hypothetical protein
MDALSGSRIGNSLSEALGLSSPGPQGVAQQQWQETRQGEAQRRTTGGDGLLAAPRLAAAERAGEAGELHPRGRFLNLKI